MGALTCSMKDEAMLRPYRQISSENLFMQREESADCSTKDVVADTIDDDDNNNVDVESYSDDCEEDECGFREPQKQDAGRRGLHNLPKELFEISPPSLQLKDDTSNGTNTNTTNNVNASVSLINIMGAASEELEESEKQEEQQQQQQIVLSPLRKCRSFPMDMIAMMNNSPPIIPSLSSSTKEP